MLEPDVTVGLTLTGALTPAGLGMAALIPLIEAGFVDWIISTGANLYHDTHFGLGLAMHRGNPQQSRRRAARGGRRPHLRHLLRLRRAALAPTRSSGRSSRARSSSARCRAPSSTTSAASTSRERETALGIGKKSLLGAAYECGVPIYTSSPGDSSIGMNVAALALEGNKCVIDPNADVNETASIVLGAKRGGGKSAVLICGGGSPKNFVLQTEPQIQEVLGIDEKGHDYFLQITDARPDTGGLSGATPAEAVSWGKIDPDRLPDAVVCYLDSTVALPLLTAYALARHAKRPLKRLLDRREDNMRVLRDEFAKASGAPDEPADTDAKLPMHR